MKITALTRTVVKRTHALITPDGYVNSAIPGWTDCEINVIISREMGANLCQTIYHLNPESKGQGQTDTSAIFFYIVSGGCDIKLDAEKHHLKSGGYAYIPPKQRYQFTGFESGTQLLSFSKTYEFLEGVSMPQILVGKAAGIPKEVYMDDPKLHMQNLLPDNPSFDMAVNIFTYQPGGNLPFVETHIMEHGLLYLAGQGVYRLDEDWYPVAKGDSIWMAPYCPQWFVAMGDEPAVYIYYKNVNRHPHTV